MLFVYSAILCIATASFVKHILILFGLYLNYRLRLHTINDYFYLFSIFVCLFFADCIWSKEHTKMREWNSYTNEAPKQFKEIYSGCGGREGNEIERQKQPWRQRDRQSERKVRWNSCWGLLMAIVQYPSYNLFLCHGKIFYKRIFYVANKTNRQTTKQQNNYNKAKTITISTIPLNK